MKSLDEFFSFAWLALQQIIGCLLVKQINRFGPMLPLINIIALKAFATQSRHKTFNRCPGWCQFHPVSSINYINYGKLLTMTKVGAQNAIFHRNSNLFIHIINFKFVCLKWEGRLPLPDFNCLPAKPYFAVPAHDQIYLGPCKSNPQPNPNPRPIPCPDSWDKSLFCKNFIVGFSFIGRLHRPIFSARHWPITMRTTSV